MSNPAFRSPTETTAPVAGTTAGLYTISPAASTILLNNSTGEVVYLRFNTTTAAAATAGAHDATAASQDTGHKLEAKAFGLHAFDYIGVWVPAGGDVSLLSIRVQ